MEYLKTEIKTMPEQPQVDYTELGKFLIAAVSIVTGFIAWVHKYFKDKKEQKEEFISRVVEATIRSSLAEYKNEFTQFKTKMETEVNHFNATVIEIYREIRK